MKKLGLLLIGLVIFVFTGCVSIQVDGVNPYSNKAQTSYVSDKDVFLMILDGSGSMSDRDRNGIVKMDAAKSIVKDIALKLDPTKTNAGLLNFSSGCYSNKLLVEPNNNNFSKLITTTQNITPSGKTPLASSIRMAGDILKSHNKKVNIVIISDGEETCGGNPVAEINRLKSIYGVNINSFVIGYAVDDNVRLQLQNLVLGEGAYFDAKDGYKLANILEQITNKLNINSEFWKNGVFDFKINFNSGSSVINKKYQKPIKRLAEYLNENDYSVEVQGHTDSQSGEKYNQKLSEKRAKAVRDALIKNGVAKNRVYSIGYGELAPIDSNSTKVGRFNNRRVEAHVIKGNGLNVDLINQANYNKPVNVVVAQTNSFVGYYKMIDTNRAYSEYHAYFKVYANNQAYSAEYLEGRSGPLIQKDVYWEYDKNSRILKLDWTNQGKYGGGKFNGEIQGNTNMFDMNGHWSNNTRGNVKFVRISKDELICMEDGGEYINNMCTNYTKSNTTIDAASLVKGLIKSFFN